MRERVFLTGRRTAYLQTLEDLLQARIGWINSAISPFARAAYDQRAERAKTAAVPQRPSQGVESGPTGVAA